MEISQNVKMTATIEKTKKLELFTDDEFKEKQGVSQAEYGRMRDMSRQNVFKHVQNGVITLLPNGNIHPESADKELADKLDPAFTPAAFDGKQAAGAKAGSFHDEKTKKEKTQRELLEIELKKKRGEFVDKVKTKNAYSNKITAVVRRLQKISKRISPAVAKESDRIKCEDMIFNEIKEAVEEFG